MKEETSVVGYDSDGYPFNKKYPPSKDRLRSEYGGYETWNRWILFYDFAVQGYDLYFKYKGKEYHFLSEPDYVAYCDDHYTEEYQRFPDGNVLIEQFEIDGKKLIDIIDELEDVEPM